MACEDLRQAWSAADAALGNSIVEQKAAEAEVVAAEQQLADAKVAKDAADAQVASDAAAADQAYTDWVNCVKS